MALPALPHTAVMAVAALSLLCAAKASRRRLRTVAAITIPLALGFCLVHGGIPALLAGASPSPERIRWAAGLWFRILSVVSAGQLWLEYVPPRVLIESLFAGTLPASLGFLLASPLLIGGQIAARLGQIREAQLARGVPVFGSFKERVSSLAALTFPLVLGLLNDLPTRSASLDMKAFGLFRRRTSLKSVRQGNSFRSVERDELPEFAVRLDGVRFVPPSATTPLLEIPGLRLRPGELMVAAGDNGSGKSTLAAMLSGGVPEHRSGTVAGDAAIFGESLGSRNTLEWSPDIQFVQQNPQLALSGCAFTVYDEIAFGPENLVLAPEEIRGRVDRALALCGIACLKERDPARLSGGEAQKLALASAVAMEPRVLILDEAFTRIHPSDVPVLAEGLAAWASERGATLLFLEKRRDSFVPWCGVAGYFETGRLLPGIAPSCRASVGPRAVRPKDSRVPAEGGPLLRIEGADFRWPSEDRPLLRSLNGSVARGERVALVGPNGAGKSTLMRLCAGLLAPECGTILLDEAPVASMSPKERARKIGFLFQDAERQIFHATVAEEVLFSLRNEPLSRAEKLERMERALEATGLAGKEKKHPLDLNAAERRMVAVASISATEPELLLLDEPTRDFDAKWTELFERWLAERTGAVLAVSHDFDFVSRAFPRVWLLDGGAIQADGEPGTVFSGPSDLAADAALE